MGHALRQRHGRLASALLCVFVASLSVTCVASAEMNETEMACCAQLAGDCSQAMAQDHGCCQTDSPGINHQLAPGPRFTALSHNLTDFVLLGPTPAVQRTGPASTFDRPNNAPPTARAVPAYLLLSTLRI